MKLQFCSDLHLEYAQNRAWLKDNPVLPEGDILVLAGDIYHLDKNYAELDFIKWAGDHFESVYVVPGNHEYYNGFDSATALESIHHKVLSNVSILNNTTVEFEQIQIVFSTMWTEIQREIPAVLRGMADFKYITFKGAPLTIDQYNALHASAAAFLDKALQVEKPSVVVTHHLPSFACNAPEFRHSPLSEAFCVDQTQRITKSNISHWIYGHSHRNIGEIQLGNTVLTSNQLGYVALNEQKNFLKAKTIQL